ncbi:hypothetical protein BDY24DRAFT_439124 [Mrakia frigida]|uniref:uncharacterized protein n=1 Tax=Mrakia frigida TaxID=29902 RepID=UPI003FCBFEA6
MISSFQKLATSSSSPPLPDLPLEIEHQILKFCDASTLATTGLVSLAWLELSAPLLHENITIQGYDHLAQLCASRLPSQHNTHLSSLLDLDRRPIQSFTFFALDSDQDVPRAFSLDRFPTWRALRVDILDLQIFPDLVGRFAPLDLHGRVYSRVLLAKNIFPLFDPHIVTISGIVSPRAPPPPPSSSSRLGLRRGKGNGPLAYLNLDRSSSWLNLQRISFNAFSGPFDPLTQSQFAKAPHRRPFTVGFDFSQSWPVPKQRLIHQHDVVASNMEELLGGTSSKRREERFSVLASRVVERVVVKVRAEGQREYLEEWMRGFWKEDGIFGEERERREGKIEWVVVGD